MESKTKVLPPVIVMRTQSKENNVNSNTTANTSLVNDSIISSSKPVPRVIIGSRINITANKPINQENTPELDSSTEIKRSRVNNILNDLLSVSSPKNPNFAINLANTSKIPISTSNNRRVKDLSINNDILNDTMKSDQKTPTPMAYKKPYNLYKNNDISSTTSNKVQSTSVESTPKHDLGI